MLPAATSVALVLVATATAAAAHLSEENAVVKNIAERVGSFNFNFNAHARAELVATFN